MISDPFGGRIPTTSRQAPFDNALTVTPSDDTDLPVIPSSIYVPARIPAIWSNDLNSPLTDQEGEIDDDAEGEAVEIKNEFPWTWSAGARPNKITMQAHNGDMLSFDVPSIVDLLSAQPLFLAFRPRKIMRTGTTLHRVTLLW